MVSLTWLAECAFAIRRRGGGGGGKLPGAYNRKVFEISQRCMLMDTVCRVTLIPRGLRHVYLSLWVSKSESIAVLH